MNPPLHVLWVGAEAPDLSASELRALHAPNAATRSTHAAQALRDAPTMRCCCGWPRAWRWPWPTGRRCRTRCWTPRWWWLRPTWRRPLATALTQRGVQDLLPQASADAATLARALRLAVQRKRLERTARKAYATDLSTGLPNHAQLLEHMTHLLALREREPAPMALLVLRIEGLSTTETRARQRGRQRAAPQGGGAGARRPARQRRGGLDRQRCLRGAAGLDRRARPTPCAWPPSWRCRCSSRCSVAGQEQAVAVSVGVSQYPEHGRQAEELLRRAIGQADGGRQRWAAPALPTASSAARRRGQRRRAG